jgi:DNA-binding NtrC family response regulator
MSTKTFAPPALARLMSYRWPGNVREFENRMTDRADRSTAR